MLIITENLEAVYCAVSLVVFLLLRAESRELRVSNRCSLSTWMKAGILASTLPYGILSSPIGQKLAIVLAPSPGF